MNVVFESLITSSIMLTIACALAALFFRQFKIVAPRLRQCIYFCVMLQGLMLLRMPMELPWLEPNHPHSSLPSNVSSSGQWSRPIDRVTAGGGIDHQAVSSVTDGIFVGQAQHETSSAVVQSLTIAQVGWYTIFIVWTMGIIVTIGIGLRRYRSLCQAVDELEPAPTDWQREWNNLCKGKGKVAPRMLVSESAGPMLVRRPQGYVLVVPVGFWCSLSADQRRGVLLHELAHLCRHDVWRQLVVRCAASFHWWNPAAWWCVRRYEESAEWACDESLALEDPYAAHGLATGLVQLVEFFSDPNTSNADHGSLPVASGLGVQSMAAPPLTARVTRLLQSSETGDPIMKRLLLGCLAVALLGLSTVQFRLVAADPDQDKSALNNSGSLEVLPEDFKVLIHSMSDRLNVEDRATADLHRLLKTDAGRIALSGVVNQIQSRYREIARDEAVPRFVDKHFETVSDDQLKLRSESLKTAEAWKRQAKQMGTVLDSMRKRMQAIAERLDDSNEVNQMARRMLTDEHAGFAIMIDQFDGRSDPIDLYLDKTLQKILVRRGDKMIVVPNLEDQGRRQIERFEMASKVHAILERELPQFAKEFARVDDQHKQFIVAMGESSMAAVVALHITKDGAASATGAVDKLFDQLEQISRDSSKGLVIDDAEAWESVQELMDYAKRANKRVDAVKDRLAAIAMELDLSDSMTARFANEIQSGVIAYEVAATLPYDDFDLGMQIESIVSQVMEPSGANGLTVRDDAAEQVRQRAEELLTASRTVRRYLRRIETVRDRLADRELADSLKGPGCMLLLAEIRRHAESQSVPTMELLSKEFFLVDESSDQLTVRPERVEVVAKLVQRAKDLEKELSKDDF